MEKSNAERAQRLIIDEPGGGSFSPLNKPFHWALVRTPLPPGWLKSMFIGKDWSGKRIPFRQEAQAERERATLGSSPSLSPQFW